MKLIGWKTMMGTANNYKQCKGFKKNGNRCKISSIFGGYCFLHQDQLPREEINDEKENK